VVSLSCIISLRIVRTEDDEVSGFHRISIYLRPATDNPGKTMENGMQTLLIVLIGLVLILAGALWLVVRGKIRKVGVSLDSGLSYMRSIGQLSVFKVITKEIVTELDHSWGEFGRKYLSWVLSERKMAMIFEIEIDFRYDLRSSSFQILPDGEGGYRFRMPPVFHDTHIRDIRFYDEQQSRLLPWLVPDLLNGFFAGRFSEEDKNRLVAAARSHAQEQAAELIRNIRPDFENSARSTLSSIARAFGVQEVEFDFPEQETGELEISLAGKLVA